MPHRIHPAAAGAMCPKPYVRHAFWTTRILAPGDTVGSPTVTRRWYSAYVR